jgi:Predicted nucleotide-binding protein containing TIR-like domain
MEKRVFVSATTSKRLDERRRLLKTAVLTKIREAGYEPQEFWESGIPENLAWNFENLDRVMRQCVGAVVFGFPRWTIPAEPYETKLVGEFNHYEGAVALTHGLPVLLLKEEGVEDRGIVWNGAGKTITYVPDNADQNWVDDPDFTKRFKAWLRELGARKDVFLGYCTKSAGTAAQIQLRLEKLGASVLNWAMDFRAGGSILSEIENARAACSCGIFLFSEDDPLEGTPGGAAPRDNVVFEAGYFMSSKGPERCLIIRHGEAKMPADVGGAIYVHLDKSADVSTIEGRLGDFLTRNL